MKKKIIELCGGKDYNFSRFQSNLKHQVDQDLILRKIAEWLCDIFRQADYEEEKIGRDLYRFGRRFFETYGDRLARNCGASHILPDHQRISRKQEQVVIELFNAARLAGFLGDITRKQLARILVCVLDTSYTAKQMVDRLGNLRPEYEELYGALKKIFTRIFPLSRG
ncbi:MAG: hypothetical protein LUG51_13090 [Tannerellaceae bacterium]|nr:hypothetical protein [Tannerellaceae bacterium]